MPAPGTLTRKRCPRDPGGKVAAGGPRGMAVQDHGPEWREREEGGFLLTFHRLFFAMRCRDSFPMAELEDRLKNNGNSALLQQILRQVYRRTGFPFCCVIGGGEILRQLFVPSSFSDGYKFVQETVLHPLCKKYPPSVKYRRFFLSELIKKHEITGTEPLDDLYDALGEVLRSEDPLVCFKNYFLLSGENITLAENVAIISEGTTGLVTWEAALYFAEWAMENPEVFKCRTVLELGSGIGLAGIAICKTCNLKQYTFSDCHPNVLKQLRKNIIRNNLLRDSDTWNSKECEGDDQSNNGSEEIQRLKVNIVRLDWGEVTQEQILELQSDIIIATDIIYDPEVIPNLVSVLEKLLVATPGRKTKTNSVVYLASTVRNPETYHRFKMELGVHWRQRVRGLLQGLPPDNITHIDFLEAITIFMTWT